MGLNAIIILVCHSHVTGMYLQVFVCHPYVTRMYLYVIRMLFVSTLMSFVRRSYVLLCHWYVIRIYSYVICMSFVCTRMSFVRRSYVLVCHPCLPRVHLCHLYVTRMWFYLDRDTGLFLYWCQSLGIWYFGAALLSLHIFVRHVYSSNSFQNTFPKPRMKYAIKLGFHYGLTWDNMR